MYHRICSPLQMSVTCRNPLTYCTMVEYHPIIAIYAQNYEQIVNNFTQIRIYLTQFAEDLQKRQNNLRFLLDTEKSMRYNCGVSQQVKGGNKMSQVKVKDNESLESALRRFKRQTSRDGVIQEVRKREHYEKPSVKRKKKSEAARKRKYK